MEANMNLKKLDTIKTPKIGKENYLNSKKSQKKVQILIL